MRAWSGWLLAAALVPALGAAPVLAAVDCSDLQGFEAQLAVLLDDFHAASTMVGSWDPTEGALFHQSVVDFEAATLDLIPEDLAALCELFELHPSLMDSPLLLESVLTSLPAGETSCLSLTRSQFLGVFITGQVLKGIAAGLQTACEATECITLACKVTCAIAGVANGAVLVTDAILEENDYCGKSLHFEFVQGFSEETGSTLEEIQTALQGAVIPPLDQTVSSRATQASVDLVQASAGDGFTDLGGQVDDLDADLTAQGADREAFQEGSLRRRIEENLQQGRQGRIVSFQLPQSAGGLLETVREVVADAILANQNAGHDVGNALDLFDQGDQAFNAQEYRSAFGSYRSAYREAVGGRETPGPGPGEAPVPPRRRR